MYELIAVLIYGSLAAVALWGLYCIVIIWTRVGQKRFKSEPDQNEFLEQVCPDVARGRFDGALQLCEGDPRALPQMVALGLENREQGYVKVRKLMLERFQRDVLDDLDNRLAWVNTVIKSAPMIGLFGTVFGMMGAFQTLATSESVDPTQLAGDINIALRTTACGLAIAVPLILLTSAVNIRIKKMEDLVGSGLSRFLEALRDGIGGR